MTRVKVPLCGASLNYNTLSLSPPLSKDLLPKGFFSFSLFRFLQIFFLFNLVMSNPHFDYICCMEANIRSEMPPPPSSLLGAMSGGVNELARLNSDTPSLTAEGCKDVLRPLVNITPDDGSAWTDAKHNLYLTHLEVSFVQQLCQSKGLLVQCSDKNQRDVNLSHKRSDVHNTCEQFTVLRNGCWQKISYERHEPLYRTSANSRDLLKNPWIFRFRHNGMHSHPPSSDMPEFPNLPTEKHNEGIISRGTTTCSHQFSASNPYHGDLLDLTREGMGENVLDEDNQKRSEAKFQPQAKRLKTALEDSSSKDQIVPTSN